MSLSLNQPSDPTGEVPKPKLSRGVARLLPEESSDNNHKPLSLETVDTGSTKPQRGEERQEAIRWFLLIADLCLIWASGETVALVTSYGRSPAAVLQKSTFPRGAAGFLLFFSVLVVLFERIYGLHEVPWKKGLWPDLGRIAKCVLFAALIAGVCNYLFRVRVAPPLSIACTIVVSGLSLGAWRSLLRSQSISGFTGNRNILIVGCGPNGELLRRHLQQNPDIGYVFKGYLDRRQTGRPPDPSRNIEEADILGAAEDLPAIVRKHFIDEVFISVPSNRHIVKVIAFHARNAGLNVRIVPDLYDGLANIHPVEYVGIFPTMTLNDPPIPTLQLAVKRLLDIVVSVSLLILLAPLLLAIALMIKLDSPGPVFYRSLRVGKKGETFLCCKFRTMVADADILRKDLEHLNERDGILFKIDADPRITRVGKNLRKFSLDEWPQLWNVLTQKMSLVGPRPSVPGEYDQYTLNHLRRLDVTPGVTGLWQVTARRDPSFESYLALDKQYVNNWSLWLDCTILYKTIGVVLSGTGQ